MTAEPAERDRPMSSRLPELLAGARSTEGERARPSRDPPGLDPSPKASAAYKMRWKEFGD